MQVKFKNSLHKCDVKFFINNEAYIIKANGNLILNINYDQININVQPIKNNKMKMDWISLWMFKGLLQDDVKLNIVCNCKALVELPKQEFCEIILKENQASIMNNVSYNSVLIENSDDSIKVINSEYEPVNIISAKRKFYFTQLIFMSAIPLYIIGIIMCIFDHSLFDIKLVILTIILFFLGTLPSLKVVFKFKKNMSNSKANELLNLEFDKKSDQDKALYSVNELINAQEAPPLLRFVFKIIKSVIK